MHTPLQRPEEDVRCLHLLLPHLTTLKQGLSLNWKLATESLGSASLYFHRPVPELQTHTTVPGFLRGCWGFELGCACKCSYTLSHLPGPLSGSK